MDAVELEHEFYEGNYNERPRNFAHTRTWVQLLLRAQRENIERETWQPLWRPHRPSMAGSSRHHPRAQCLELAAPGDWLRDRPAELIWTGPRAGHGQG